MRRSLSNHGRAARSYDAWLTTDLPGEREHAKEIAIEERAIHLYREMINEPDILAETLQESYSEDWALFAAALSAAIRRETPSYDIQYLKRVTDTASELLMDASMNQAKSWYEGLS